MSVVERNKIFPCEMLKNTLGANTSKLCLCKCTLLASHVVRVSSTKFEKQQWS